MSRDDRSVHILKKIVIDGFLLCGLIATILATNYAWEIFERGFFCGDESLMFPYKPDTVTVPMLRAFGLCLPYLAIFICEWALLRTEPAKHQVFGVMIPRWLEGFYCAAICFSIGICCSEILANVAKGIIGRPRPHFFDVCQPSVDCNAVEWQNRYIESKDYTCTGPRTELFADLRKSFLSGHTSWAAYSMVFLAMYLEKRMTWRGTRVVRHVLQFAAILLSWFTALSRVSDYKHHWSDVLAGYSMGVIVAVATIVWGTDFIQKEKKHDLVPQNEIPISIVH